MLDSRPNRRFHDRRQSITRAVSQVRRHGVLAGTLVFFAGESNTIQIGNVAVFILPPWTLG